MVGLALLLVVLGFLVALFSVGFVSEATLGVWFMAGAIFLAALARIAQAAGQHSEVMKHLRGEVPHQEEKSADPSPAISAE